jgi:phage-related tail protein
MDDRKSIMDRITGATEETVARVQQEMSQNTVVTATKERATAMRLRAQQAAMSQLQLATREDVARLQASLDRVEAALNDLGKRLPESKPRPRSRAPKPATPSD